MQQLPAFFVYLSAAVFIPVLLARYLIGAEWRTVRNASLVWYGFLALAFGGLHKLEGLGWALIFAMFYSIPALPVIALLMRGAHWLRHRLYM